MFESLGRIVMRARYLVVLAWLAVALLSATLAPKLSVVGAADESSFLPSDVDSIVARDVLARAFPTESSAGTATIVLVRTTGLTAADHAYASAVAGWLLSAEAPEAVRHVVVGVATAASQPELASMFRSPDGQLELVSVRLRVAPFQRSANDSVDAIRARLTATAPDGLTAHVTGATGIGRDYLSAIVEGTDRTTLVTIVLVIAILLLIYRAPIAALVPLLTIGAAFVTARGLLGVVAEAGWKLPSLMDSFIVVLVFGVGTDYTIFLISRFREELGRHERREAGIVTVGRIGAVITASAATVVVGLSAMAVGRFGLINRMGPGLALAIVVTLVAGLTLAPALLSIAGRHLFWPRHAAMVPPIGREGEAARGSAGSDPTAEPAETGVWAAVARLITTRPGLLSAGVLVLLALPLVGLSQLRTSFDVLSELPATSDARIGFDAVAQHVDRGQLLPVTALIEASGTDLSSPAGVALLDRATRQLRAVPGVKTVRSLVDPAGTGAPLDAFRPSVQLATMAEGFSVPGDPTAALAELLKPATATRLEAAAAYLAGLGAAFPDVASGSAFQGVVGDLGAERAAVVAIQALPEPRDPLRVAQLAAPLASLTGRLRTELTTLGATFAGRSDDLFIPASAAGSSAGQASGTAAGLLATYLSPGRDVARLYVVTAADPYAEAAFSTVRRVRTALGSTELAGSVLIRTYVGGTTAEFADIQTTIDGDLRHVALITVAGIFLVLVLLLRSLVAPVYLVLSVLLSYGTSLGLAALVFQGLLGQPGVNYFIPLIVFVLLVALGSDYNIFLMSRVREEVATRELRAGIRVASIRTGTVITSAGVILAGTFAALISGQLQILFQAGVAVALGVLIDTFLVRSLLVPALTALLGEVSWWPLGRGREHRAKSAPVR
jgi:putative drug exporter of the RND superfamily